MFSQWHEITPNLTISIKEHKTNASLIRTKFLFRLTMLSAWFSNLEWKECIDFSHLREHLTLITIYKHKSIHVPYKNTFQEYLLLQQSIKLEVNDVNTKNSNSIGHLTTTYNRTAQVFDISSIIKLQNTCT